MAAHPAERYGTVDCPQIITWRAPAGILECVQDGSTTLTRSRRSNQTRRHREKRRQKVEGNNPLESPEKPMDVYLGDVSIPSPATSNFRKVLSGSLSPATENGSDAEPQQQVSNLNAVIPDSVPEPASNMSIYMDYPPPPWQISTCCPCHSHWSSCPGYCTLYWQMPLIPDPLDPSRPVFRLIRLLPGRGDEPLQCIAFCVSRPNPFEFSALSYVWGTDTPRHSIMVNGHILGITVNLYAALIHLRQPFSVINLWVDAICIDQNNLDEKSYQVEHMPTIYCSAKKVVAWLGAASEGSDLAMKYIADRVRCKASETESRENLAYDIINTVSEFSSRPYWVTAKAQASGDLASDIEAALLMLWARPYWSRVWVVQELASAHKARRKCIFRCGNRSVSFAAFESFIDIVLKTTRFTGRDAIMAPRRLITLSKSACRMRYLEILWDSALLESTNPLDRIYGIRSISPAFYREILGVDYSLDFPELCLRVVACQIKGEGSLDFLCYFRPLMKSPSDGLPSWLPDLRHRSPCMPPFTYHCSAGRRAIADIFLDNILYARGIRTNGIVDEVKGPYQIQRPDSPFHTPLSVGMKLPKLEELENLVLPVFRVRYADENQRESRFMDMVAGDMQHQMKGASKADRLRACRELWATRISCEAGMMADKEKQENERQFGFIFERVLHRCFFTTSDGRVGLGPAGMQKDDVVCILYGCSLCVVLRKSSPDHYSFVGPAYVDGAMSGEYVRMSQNGEDGIKEMEFWII